MYLRIVKICVGWAPAARVQYEPISSTGPTACEDMELSVSDEWSNWLGAVPPQRCLVESRENLLHCRAILYDLYETWQITVHVYIAHAASGWNAGLKGKLVAAFGIGLNVRLVVVTAYAEVMK